jgi:hypothetical protein
MEWINKILEFLKSAQIEMWVVFILVVVEYWLGKTDVVKPGSTLEVILSGIKKVIDFIKGIIGKKV